MKNDPEEKFELEEMEKEIAKVSYAKYPNENNALVATFNTILYKKMDKKLQEKGPNLRISKLINLPPEKLNLTKDEGEELEKIEHEVYMEWLGFDPKEYRPKDRKGEIKTKKKVFPTLEPVEKNLINLPIWYSSIKGLPKQKLEIKTWTIKKDNLQIEYDYQLSLPTIFTFEIVGILLGIWQDQGYSDTFYTTLGETCKRKGIPSTHGNRDLVLIALRQLHNTYISTPFWEIDNKGKKKRKSVWKINIINIEAENIQPGRNHTIELRVNKYIANNIKRRYFTLLDYELLNKLKSPTAKRLYPIIKQYTNPYQRKLSQLKKLLNLRDRHAKQTIERASQELVNIDFLSSFKIEKGRRVNGLIYRAYPSKKLKGSKTALKGQ